jgi:4-amino-4-deoxy-L-arabinose transferase-like glycosyltransferase
MMFPATEFLPFRSASLVFRITFVTMIALFAAANLPWTLDDYDQAKQAFISYQMLEQQRWLFQTTPTEGLPALGERHTQFHISSKPPAVGWASAGVYLLTRSWDLAWRLPSFIAAAALAALIFRTAKNAFGDFGAVIALAAFGFNMLSMRLATLVRTDMPLALASFAAGAIIFEKIRTRRAWTSRDRALLFGFLLAAMFIKGPIVWAFVLPPLLIYSLFRKWRDDLPSAWSGWWPWVASFAIFIAWVIAGILFVPGFYDDVIRIEFAGRFHEGIHHSQPLLFYIPHLLEKFAPWSLVIVLLFGLAARERWRRPRQRSRQISPETLWLVLWAVGGIVVMSLIPSKRVDRIFPAIPPLCLLLAAQVKFLAPSAGGQPRLRRMAVILIVLSGVFIASYTATRVVRGYRMDRNVLDKFGSQVRQIARSDGLRYEVLRSPDEGLLLYLQRPRFLTIERALELWQSGVINSLVARKSDTDQLGQFPGLALPPRLETTRKDEQATSYIFVTRSRPAIPTGVAPH